MDLAPLWVVLKDIIPKEPKTVCAPALWRFADVKASIHEAGGLITAEDAQHDYGVIIADGSIDHAATRRTRAT
jgi:gentisate 1,2-dioxygenase